MHGRFCSSNSRFVLGSFHRYYIFCQRTHYTCTFLCVVIFCHTHKLLNTYAIYTLNRQEKDKSAGQYAPALFACHGMPSRYPTPKACGHVQSACWHWKAPGTGGGGQGAKVMLGISTAAPIDTSAHGGKCEMLKTSMCVGLEGARPFVRHWTLERRPHSQGLP